MTSIPPYLPLAGKEEHESILSPEFDNLSDELVYMNKILDNVLDIPIDSGNFPKEPNLDFSSAVEILSKD